MARNHEDIEIIARHAKRLDREAKEILEYQLEPYTSRDIHEALFGDETPQPRTLGELKEGLGRIFVSATRSVKQTSLISSRSVVD
jgi:hypothetical protein